MTVARRLSPEELNDWLAAAALELGLEGSEVSVRVVLDVAADVAHTVARPAAPLSTFLLGLALGRASSPAVTLEHLASRLSELAKGWSDQDHT